MSTKILYQDSDYFLNIPNALHWRYRSGVMSAFMLASDLICLFLSIWMSINFWAQVRSDFPIVDYYRIMPLLVGVCLSFYFLMGLYPGLGVGPVEELKRLTKATTFFVLGLIAFTFYSKTSDSWSRAIIGLAWTFALISVPITRKIFRRLALYLQLWGMPVALVGTTNAVINIYRGLEKRPLAGLKPVICAESDSLSSLFVNKTEESEFLKMAFQKTGILVIAFGNSSFTEAKNILTQSKFKFRKVIIMFDEERIGSLSFESLHFNEHFGLELSHHLLNQAQLFVKRCLDLFLALVAAPIFIILALPIGLGIKLNSNGPVFFKHQRIGRFGKTLDIIKFRTMYANANEVLSAHLEQDNFLKQEWEGNFKLKYDPRITRIGNFLRRTSLDELPQIWNVIKGEMSFIGPRPIVQEEVDLYGEEFEIYKQVLPGMTGLWQISGRNSLSYRERVNLDVYYVQNWSVWLDIHILLHTVLAVLQGRGAY
jgi:Undecaprenyl-phosphate galactose phosphotransferase WbaP